MSSHDVITTGGALPPVAPLADLGGPFDVIYADPPWRFASNSAARPGKNPMRHYPCMPIEEIEALPVAEVAARDAVLFMWTTAPFAELAFRVVKAWGFRYVSQVAWVKERIGTGYWARNRHEPLYICRRGRIPCPRPAMFPDSVIEGQQREHSRKPDEVADRIARAFPDARRLEMFARQPRDGWTVWGNQTEKFAPAGANKGVDA